MTRQMLSLSLTSTAGHSTMDLATLARDPLVDAFPASNPAIDLKMLESNGERAMVELDWSFDVNSTLPPHFFEGFLARSFAAAGITLSFLPTPDDACAA